MKTQKIGCGKDVWRELRGEAKIPVVQICGTNDFIVAQLPTNIRLKSKEIFYCKDCKKKLNKSKEK